MVKFIDKLKETFKLYNRQSIIRINLFQKDQFYMKFDVKLSSESPLTSLFLKQELFLGSQIMVLNNQGLQFQQDLGMAESEFKDLQDYQIGPNLVIYDDSEKRILITKSLLQNHALKKGVLVGELTQSMNTNQEDTEFIGQTLLLNDIYKERMLKLFFLFSGLLFLTQASYQPERCSEDFISSKESLSKLTQKQ